MSPRSRPDPKVDTLRAQGALHAHPDTVADSLFAGHEFFDARDLAQVKYEPYHELIGELKAEGKVRFSGLSNHGADLSLFGPLDDPMDQVVMAAAEDGRFDIALFVYNFLQREAGDQLPVADHPDDYGHVHPRHMPLRPRLLQAGQDMLHLSGTRRVPHDDHHVDAAN